MPRWGRRRCVSVRAKAAFVLSSPQEGSRCRNDAFLCSVASSGDWCDRGSAIVHCARPSSPGPHMLQVDQPDRTLGCVGRQLLITVDYLHRSGRSVNWSSTNFPRRRSRTAPPSFVARTGLGWVRGRRGRQRLGLHLERVGCGCRRRRPRHPGRPPGARPALAGSFGRDLPAALLEDADRGWRWIRDSRCRSCSVTQRFDAIIIGAGQAGPSLAWG